MTTTHEQQDVVADAQRVLREAYYRDVRSVADDLKKQIDEGNFDDREAFLEGLHETIDGHRRVIITGQAMQGVVFSSQDADLAINEYGSDAFDFSDGIPWSKLMYVILERDVIECLDTIGVDVNDPIPSDDSEGGA